MAIRQPYVGTISTIDSPIDATIKFDIKRCGVSENIARQNMAATMRYVEQEASTKVVTERDYPLGNMRRDTILLALAGWNLTNDTGVPIPITKDTLVQYLDPKEFDFIYDKVLEVNPMWANGGEEEVKNG